MHRSNINATFFQLKLQEATTWHEIMNVRLLVCIIKYWPIIANTP